MLVKRLPFVITLTVGIFIGIAIGKIWPVEEKGLPHEFQIRQGGYSFINPLLECEIADDVLNEELRPFKYKVKDLVNERINSKKVEHISVYFRDLNNGPWFGINEKEEFSPASMLKVPIMIAYFKMAESSPDILKRTIRYQNSDDQNKAENIKSTKAIESGKSYTIEELIHMMIVYSDNNAKDLLINDLDMNVLAKTYSDLGVNMPTIDKLEDFMSVKSYASFFRILFNASYLSKELSEKALSYLTVVEFNQGLLAGVPPFVPVAHKFGERAFDNSRVKQLHDCGIVYYPGHPYLLCIMSRGNDFGQLRDAIRDISGLVFNEVDRQYQKK